LRVHIWPIGFISCLVILAVSGACKRDGEVPNSDPLVLYCSVDEAFARNVIEAYQQRTGQRVSTIFDTEAGKTTGLVNRISSEAASGRPRADVFWSSELFNTILLGRKGLLQPYDSPAAADIPQRYRDPEHRWTALAARARVLAFDPKRTNASDIPNRWEDLAEPASARRFTLANPLFGTTRGHVAAMFALWGPERGRTFLTRLREGEALISAGNSSAVRAVIARSAEYCATDTDDVWVAQRGGASLDLVYPDMGDGGTLLIPCSVAIVKGSDNLPASRKLVDYLVSAEVEKMLAESDSRNIPVRRALREQLGLEWPPESQVTFDAIADAMDDAVSAVREILIR